MNSLREIRLLLGLSQRKFAVLLDIERSTYSMMEIGKRPAPDHVVFQAIALKDLYFLQQSSDIESETDFPGITQKIDAAASSNDQHILNDLELQKASCIARIHKMEYRFAKAEKKLKSIASERRLYPDNIAYMKKLDGMAAKELKIYVANHPKCQRAWKVKLEGVDNTIMNILRSET